MTKKKKEKKKKPNQISKVRETNFRTQTLPNPFLFFLIKLKAIVTFMTFLKGEKIRDIIPDMNPITHYNRCLMNLPISPHIHFYKKK